MMWSIVLAIVFGFAAIFLAWYARALRYWKQKGLYNPEPSFLFGNVKDAILQKQSLGEIFRDIYFDLKSKDLRHGGAYFFAKPEYIPVDLNLIKAILQNDFQYFNSHGGYVNETADPLSGHIFNLEGIKWKCVRNKLTPTFTSGKMKMMFQTLVDCTYTLEHLLDKSARNPIDVKDIMGRFTTDIIGSCAFGLDINSMENGNTDFRKYGTRVFDLSLVDTLRQTAVFFVPHSILRFFNISMFSSDIIEFFHRIVKENIKYREDNNIERKDLMHLMIQLKTKNSDQTIGNKESIGDDEGLTVNDIAAQSFLFFVAGFETSSTTMNFAAYELAVNLDIQEKARQEINEVLLKYNDQLTYEGVMGMVYLDKVIYETLRKYPPLQFLFRKCLKNYKVPDTDLEIEAGTAVQIPVLGIHYDPDYYPFPNKFDPDRFNEEAKNNRPQFTWLPFGEGPRICLGQRFGMLQTKVGLITLLRKYTITLNKKTKTPLVFKKTGIISASEGGIWIDIQKIK